MSLNLGDIAPNFTADTTHGMINFYEWMNNSWTILLTLPEGFNPVCTTELIWLTNNIDKFKAKGVNVICLSFDKLVHYSKWISDIKQKFCVDVNVPIIADKTSRIAKLYGMINSSIKVKQKLSTIPSHLMSRVTYFISPDKKISSMMNYPQNTGRNFGEILRVIDSLLLTTDNNYATPVNWYTGNDVLHTALNTSSENNSLELITTPVSEGNYCFESELLNYNIA